MSKQSKVIRSSRFQEFVHRFTHPPCRQCGAETLWIDDVCHKCGTFAPVRIPFAQCFIVALMSNVAIILVRLSGA